MNKYFTLIIILLSSLQCLSRNDNYDYNQLLAKEDSLLRFNDTEGLKLLCDEIIEIDSLNRDHLKEVEMLKLAIDYMNIEMVGFFYERKIGLYDETMDSITPIEYLLDDNFINRVKRGLRMYDSETAEQLHVFMPYILLAFQPFNDKIFELCKMRLESLLEIADELKAELR